MIFRKLRLVVLISVLCFTGCSRTSGGLRDGYYTAETADFDARGWKEYILIRVSEGKIITVEYDAFNRSGFAKSWDLEYMRVMQLTDGTYPNEFTRLYAVSLLNWQNPDNVDAISGATESHSTFLKLAEAAIENAKAGNNHVAEVK